MSRRSVQQIVAQCRTIYEDLDFSVARRWKDARQEGKVIGFMPVYVPREIIHAAGMLPLGIPGCGADHEHGPGEASDGGSGCRTPHTAIEQVLADKIDLLDGMIFPSICDATRKLSLSWQQLFKKKYVRYFETPQQSGGTFFLNQLRELKEGLEKLGGRRIPDADINHSIAVYNENRRWVNKVYDYRAEQPWKAPSGEVYLLMRAGMTLEVEDHTLLLQEYLAAAEAEGRSRKDFCRVALTGAYCDQPPLDMIESLEAAGWYIVDDDFLLVNRWIRGNIDTSGEPLANLAEAFVRQSEETAAKYPVQVGVKGGYLLDGIEERRADGVIFAAPGFCEPALLDQPKLISCLEARSIPHQTMQYIEDLGKLQPIQRALVA